MTNAPKKSPGRPRGSVNYRARLARDIMERLKCDPLEALLRIVKNRRLPIDVRLDAAKAAAPFCYPRLATVMVNSKSESEVNIQHRVIQAAYTDPKLAAALETLSLAASASDCDVIDVPAHAALPAPEPEQEADSSTAETEC